MASFLAHTIRSYHTLRKSDPSSEKGMAWKCILENVTYRLDTNAAMSKVLALKQFVRLARTILKGDKCFHSYDRESDVAVLEAQFVYIELEEDSMLRQAPTPPSLFISKSHLPSVLSFWELIRLAFFTLPIILRTYGNEKDRMNLSMHVLQVAENAALLKFCKEKGIKHIYDFAPYLIDHNWSYLLLREQGIRVTKLPSPGPLATHHDILFADELVVSTPYQLEEVEALPNIHVEKINKWLLESAFLYIDRYIEMDKEPPSKTVAFYSHGGWLRLAQGHTDDGLNIPAAEKRLLEHLATFVKAHPDFKVLIYPHPREKKDEVWERTQSFYASFFQDLPFEIVPKDTRTTESFEQADIAVASFSTILYERIFCGYKTLIGNFGIAGFPMTNSSLEAICFDTEVALHSQLNALSSMSRDEYFETYGLTEYRYSTYPYFKEHGTDH